MIPENENTEVKRKRRSPSSEKKLRKLALDTIISMVNDTELKPSDRLSAVKALLDYIKSQPEKAEDSAVRVIFENMPEGFAD
ncbi:MAG: hypothetical protein IKZ82_07485 [Clostridia bacterium]|nr:hypothetical protein [Clostridia bacterium]